MLPPYNEAQELFVCTQVLALSNFSSHLTADLLISHLDHFYTLKQLSLFIKWNPWISSPFLKWLLHSVIYSESRLAYTKQATR